MFSTRVQGNSAEEVRGIAELLAAAARAEGRQAAASVTSGDGRAVSVCVIDGAMPRAEEQRPIDALIVHDPAELRRADVFGRLHSEAYLLVNAACGFGDLGVAERVERFCRDRALILPAARLGPGALDGLVRCASMVGGFAALSRVVRLDSVVAAIQDKVPASSARACVQAAESAYWFVRIEKEALAA